MTKQPQAGDRVSWNGAQGKVEVKLVRKLTKTIKIKGHTAKATSDDPQYLVESGKTGEQAAHKPEQLKKS